MNDYLNLEVQKDLAILGQTTYEGGPRATKLLAYKIRKQQSQTLVEQISVDNNTFRTGEEITNQFAEFYTHLYNVKEEEKITPAEISKFFQNIVLPQVTDEQNSNLVEDISEIEIKTHISKLKLNKSPGSDSFTNEFYKEFKNEIIPILNKAFNWALNNGTWASTWNTGIITVICKPGKNPSECASYRLITLLNTDHKILTAILTNRLSKITPLLVKSDQSGFISQRYLVDNVRRTLNAIDRIQKHNIPAGILTLDAEKAYDNVLWPYLFETLKQYGMHYKFVNWMEAIYKNVSTRVRVNGALSHSFNLFKGLRQGDPLSGLLFALCIEPLAERIRQEPLITGLPISGECHKLSLNADDIIVYLTNPELSITPLMKTIQEFSEVSGYKLNINKSDIMVFGCSVKEEFKKKYPFHWDSTVIKYLGVNITKDLGDLFIKNYGELINEMKRDFNRWSLIPFSLWEKVNIIQMNVLPRLLFLFTALPLHISCSSFKYWDSLITKFLWKHKQVRIALSYLKLPKEVGGVGLPNLRTYYQAAHIRNIIEWMTGKCKTKWRDMEENSEVVPFSILPLIEYKKEVRDKVENRWV